MMLNKVKEMRGHKSTANVDFLFVIYTQIQSIQNAEQ